MRRRWFLNLMLVVAVAALGWLALGKQDDNKAVNKLINVDPLSITQLHIAHRGQPPINLEKRGKQWFMTEPYQCLANNSHMNKILSVIETPSLASFSAERDLGPYGLDKATVELSMNQRIHLKLGDTDPVSKNRYVQTGDSIHVIADSPFAQLTAAASLLVDTALFAEGINIQSIQLPAARLDKQADGRWQVSPAADYSADSLNTFVDNWKHARAVFVSDPEKPQAGEQQVTIMLDDQQQYVFGIVKLDTGVTLVNRKTGLHYHLAEDSGKQLLQLPAAN